jgi:hypothetical protein
MRPHNSSRSFAHHRLGKIASDAGLQADSFAFAPLSKLVTAVQIDAACDIPFPRCLDGAAPAAHLAGDDGPGEPFAGAGFWQAREPAILASASASALMKGN